MSKESSSSGGGLGFCGAMFLLFLGLKLAGIIEWSWWWVSAPLWIPVLLVAVVLAILGVVVLFAKRRKTKRQA